MSAASPVDAARFEFGQNWKQFLQSVDETRIDQAIAALRSMLDRETLADQRVLDLGSGSGLMSLAAHRLGATVVSIDYDPQSVRCTQELRRRFTDTDADSDRWSIRQGSALDSELMTELGQFDLVYSWGVLHHTGQMYRAIELASQRVAPGGTYFLAIYNDQGSASRRWLSIKKTYHRLPRWSRGIWVCFIAGIYESKFALARLARLRNPLPLKDWAAKKKDRGMSVWYDWVDWVGGMPFEVAKPEQILLPLARRGFRLTNLKTVGNGWGCNEYVLSLDSCDIDSRDTN